MPRFGFIGDEENLEQKMIATPEREEPPAKHVTAREVDVDLTVRAPVVGSKEHQYLLDEVATNWKTGKGSHQTEHVLQPFASLF